MCVCVQVHTYLMVYVEENNLLPLLPRLPHASLVIVLANRSRMAASPASSRDSYGSTSHLTCESTGMIEYITASVSEPRSLKSHLLRMHMLFLGVKRISIVSQLLLYEDTVLVGQKKTRAPKIPTLYNFLRRL